MTTIAIEELELHLREVLARVEAGETVLLARDGEAVAQIAPCESVPARLERLFPGMQHATVKPSALWDFVPVRLPEGVDAVAMLIEDREERDLLS